MSAGKKRANSNAFNIASMRTKGSKTSNSPRKADKPFFEVMACIYQEGEQKGKPTGNMLVNFKLIWEKRDEASKLLPEHFLVENQRWNQEKKLYTVRV